LIVPGLDVFSSYFASFPDCYCLIGGSALSLIYEEADLSPRATKDLDVVVLLNAKTPSFVRKIVSFAKDGGYGKAEANPSFCSYRFSHPSKSNFPKEVELFTKEKKVGYLLHKGIQHLSLSEGVSFSSIIVDEAYYLYISQNHREGQLSFVEPYAIVPLKAKAYLENRKLFERGSKGISKATYQKHERDIIRFIHDFPLKVNLLPPTLREDCQRFYEAVAKENIDYQGITHDFAFSQKEFLELFRQAYLQGGNEGTKKG
jgi:hypothetical protein